jgi:hypothetical protein
MKLLGKLKISAKKSGINIDLTKMGDGSNYAERVLKEFSNSEDHEMVAIAFKLMHQLGLLEMTMDLSET